MLLAVFSMVAFAANAFQVTANIDDPSRVTVSVNYAVQTVVAGDNTFELTDGGSIMFQATDGNILTSVMRNGTTPEYISSMNQCGIYVNATDHTGAKWTVKSSSLADARTASCEVTVDDASMVLLRTSGTYTRVNLQNGKNVVKFMPEVETPFSISSNDYNKPLYSVKKNGADVTAEWGTYTVAVADGDKIEVAANYPDIDCPVKFNLSEKAAGFITKVTVNGTEVTNYADANFSVKAGSSVAITGNTSDYKVDSFKVNGSSQSFYGTYTFTVVGETVVDIDAHKYGTYKVNVNVDNIEHVTVYNGYSYYNKPFNVKNGDNVVEVVETAPVVAFKANSGCYLISVSDGTTDYVTTGGNSEVSVYVTDGMSITVKTGAINRDKKMVFFIDDKSAAKDYFSFVRQDRSSVDVASGYNVIDFYSGDAPFGFSFYGAEYKNVYKNDEVLAPMYEGSASFEFKAEDGDVYKAFLAKNPAKVKATFDVAGDVSNVEVKKDVIKTVADWANGFEALEGTQVALTAKAGTISVKADGADVAANEDGAYIVVLNKDTEIAVTIGSGVDGINTDKAADNNVYNVNGVLVIKNATPDQIENLDKGFYIINGKKVIR